MDIQIPYFEETPGSKLTPALIERVYRVMCWGHYLPDAAIYVEVSAQTLREWNSRGKDDIEAGVQSKYAVFAEYVLKAEFFCKDYLIDLAMKGAAKDPRLALQILQARFPEQWGKRETRHVTGQVDILHSITQMMNNIPADAEISYGPSPHKSLPAGNAAFDSEFLESLTEETELGKAALEVAAALGGPAGLDAFGGED